MELLGQWWIHKTFLCMQLLITDRYHTIFFVLDNLGKNSFRALWANPIREGIPGSFVNFHT
jgi:hypothetical protein